MKYCISFTSGELAGKTFPLKQDKLLSIGRSNTVDVKLSAQDISPRHLTVQLSKSNVALVEVLSTKVTMHNGKKLSMGDCIEMSLNGTIQLGASEIFTFQTAPVDAVP